MINLHVKPSGIENASRVLKETKSLANNRIADKIIVAAMKKASDPPEEKIDDYRGVVYIKTIFTDSTNFLLRLASFSVWQALVFLKFANQPVSFVNCHSLSTLPVGVLFRLFRGARLIYDAHELETETLGMVGARQLLARLTERLLINQADAVIVVNESIGEWYRKAYSLDNVHIVKNVPNPPAQPIIHSDGLRRQLNLKDTELLFLFQGYLRASRNVPFLLEAFAKLGAHYHILFLGFGELEDKVKEYESQYPNIHFKPAVPPEKVLEVSSGADVGICFFERVCLNNYYALPNKVYEYIMSGLPCIVNDFPEMRRVVEEGQCGWKVANNDEFISLVSTLTPQEIRGKQGNAVRYSRQIGWDKEERALLQAFLSA